MRLIIFPLVEFLVERLTYLCPILCLLIKKIHKAKFEIEAKDTNLQKAKKLPL